ncbi:MAG: MgtC/SapB family protein [Caldilineales bacterium]|nr:MgtC/SapB family protein [Caldilineales bacterium]MDW8316881.1 MgtC/SapB family protein [Anaerolineae bacterium]
MAQDVFADPQWTYAGQLLLAAFLGGLIGLEREAGRRPAGMRTFMLVTVGSTLFTILSIHAFPTETGVRDSARVAAQIVSGIGFLGVGTIWRSQNAVKGLTTAAGLWVAAAIGMAVGAGYGLLAAATTVLVLIILVVLRRVEKRLPHRNEAAQPKAAAVEPPEEA